MKGISEAEKRGKMLKEEQKQMKENVAAASKQVIMSYVAIIYLLFKKTFILTDRLANYHSSSFVLPFSLKFGAI